jgi:hypothetical protein
VVKEHLFCTFSLALSVGIWLVHRKTIKELKIFR